MLSLLLHHHQPDYRDPRTGNPVMPWVRLHATRGYLDVATAIHQTGARVTVNLVPSLLDQLDHYAAGGSDVHLDVARRPADTLSPDEARWMRHNFFHGHPSIFEWFPVYGAIRRRQDALDTQGLRDLQVWSNLAWFGWAALARFPELGDLRRKGRNFSEQDKTQVLTIQARLLRELRQLHHGLPDVSATPYFHPILPLLVDTRHAARNLPHPVDPGFSAPEDALAQLVEGKARVEAWIDGKVHGCWPSEGSVSAEVVALIRQAGFQWFATDEGILARSQHETGAPCDTWEVDGVRALFRSREGSDRIGFVYSTWDGKAAAADLLARLGNRAILALDGENPWEAYRDAGRDFLHHLFSSARLRTCTDAAKDPPKRIQALHTGSWIGANFAIWIGHADDVAAWRLLVDARRAWAAAGFPAAGRRSLHAAEGSDWFWWYGPEFETPFQDVFDALFRAHLRAVWASTGRPHPAALDRPVARRRGQGRPARAPLGERGWFAVAGAGHVDIAAGSMAPGDGVPERLYYGHRAGVLELWVDPPLPGWHVVRDGQEVHLQGPGGLRLPAEGGWRIEDTTPERPD